MINSKIEEAAEKLQDTYTPKQIEDSILKYSNEYATKFNRPAPAPGFYIGNAYYLLALKQALKTGKKIKPSDFEPEETKNVEVY